MDQTLGAYTILACRKAMDEAGVTSRGATGGGRVSGASAINDG
jgi:hypothetical protein